MRRLFAWLPLLAAVVLVQPASAYHLREGFEVFGVVRYMASDDAFFENDESSSGNSRSVEIDPTITGGAGFGINWNGYINTNVQVAGGPTDFDYSNGQSLDNGVMLSADLNLEVNLIDGPITPFIAGGIGIVTFSGDNEDEFGGEINVSETQPAGNVGAGMRFDIGDHLFIKGFYRLMITTLDDTKDPLLFHGAGVAIGWQF